MSGVTASTAANLTVGRRHGDGERGTHDPGRRPPPAGRGTTQPMNRKETTR